MQKEFKTVRDIVGPLAFVELPEDEKVTYSAKTLMFNIDFFKDWTRTMQSMIHSGQTEILLKMVPNIGSEIFKELSK